MKYRKLVTTTGAVYEVGKRHPYESGQIVTGITKKVNKDCHVHNETTAGVPVSDSVIPSRNIKRLV